MATDLSIRVSGAVVRSTFADDAEFREVLEPFVMSALQKRQELQLLWSENRLAEMQKLAHQLKGCGGGFGFPNLTPLAAAAEQACRSADPAAVESRLPPLLNFLGHMSL